MNGLASKRNSIGRIILSILAAVVVLVVGLLYLLGFTVGDAFGAPSHRRFTVVSNRVTKRDFAAVRAEAERTAERFVIPSGTEKATSLHNQCYLTANSTGLAPAEYRHYCVLKFTKVVYTPEPLNTTAQSFYSSQSAGFSLSSAMEDYLLKSSEDNCASESSIFNNSFDGRTIDYILASVNRGQHGVCRDTVITPTIERNDLYLPPYRNYVQHTVQSTFDKAVLADTLSSLGSGSVVWLSIVDTYSDQKLTSLLGL